MLPAKLIADYILTKANPEVGETITNLKLQKLLYYVQGFHLAIKGEKLFSNKVYAWNYGPVVVDVYHEFKEYGANPLPVPNNFDYDSIPEEVQDLIDEVWDVYGQYSALKLMNLTHEESPWKDTNQSDVISDEKMKAYFLTQLNSNEE